MGFLRRLFGMTKSDPDKPFGADRWTVSENGNPTMIVESTRITIFQQDRGWKYCIGDVDDRDDPYFSDEYATERDAQEEALAHVRGEPSRHQSLSESSAENTRQRWEVQIEERSKLIKELRQFLTENPDSGITALRKPEAKIVSHLKQLDWQIAKYRSSGVAAAFVSLAEQHKPALNDLAKEVAARIEAKQAERPPRKKPVSNSQLSVELAQKVDDLIELFADANLIDPSEAARRYSRAMHNAAAKMLDDGMTAGQASETPDFLNQDEESFRASMKKVDQDLGWQCNTVSAAFQRYLEIGETPAPHYPMRVAVLLRKAKDFDREKQFLEGWCKHFPSGNGAKYAQLVKRADKVSAIRPV